MNSKPTPLIQTLRGEIDPVDSENDNESIDYVFLSKTLIFQWIRSQLRSYEPYGRKSTPLIPNMTTRASIVKNLYFSMNSKPTPLIRTLRGGNRPRRFRKWQKASIVKNLQFSMNSRPTPPIRTLQGEIGPVDSENDNETVDSQRPSFFYEFEANSAHTNPTGGNRPRRFRKWQREHRLRFVQIFTTFVSFSSYLKPSPPLPAAKSWKSGHDRANCNEKL